MSRHIKFKEYVGDFETTVYKGQLNTEVWASALVDLSIPEPEAKDVTILHSIEETFEYLDKKGEHAKIYYHNLKFDGEFWLSYLLTRKDYKESEKDENGNFPMYWKLKPGRFTYLISSMGQWYSVVIRTRKNKVIMLWDSLKLLPFSVKQIGPAFNTKHRKLSMEYKGLRYAGCVITDKEKEYIANDVLVVDEALRVMFADGHKSMTIGGCCLAEYKKTVKYDELFPRLEEMKSPEYTGCKTADEYIRKSYKGGWCYVKKGREGIIAHNGCVADVNSLYPSEMHSDSGNRYPIGAPTWWKGEIPQDAKDPDHYYFVRIRCSFNIKKGFLPFIQIKHTLAYKGNEMLETSDIIKDGKRYEYIKPLGKDKPERVKVEITLTQTDYELLHRHYDVEEEVLDGCYFDTCIGIFDEYINKYRDIKMRSKGAKRTEAKLFLNNLYGKMATSTDADYKEAYIADDGSLHFTKGAAAPKKAGYIACGSAITSYARNFTITAAQKNYEHFIYADTDSIHCDCGPDELKGVPIDDVKFCHWKIENTWSEAIFVRQKTYIEKEGDDYLVKCAGMPKNCKEKIIDEMRSGEMKLSDFKPGLKVDGKLMPKHIPGGVVLMETTFKIKV